MFRKSELKDVDKIMHIINQAQEYIKSQDIDQWQNGYPNSETIKDDIKNGVSYVLEEEGNIVATTVISFDGEPTYDKIYDGAWLSNYNFAVIHRIAVNNDYKGRGLAGKLIKETENFCKEKNLKSIRIDTHTKNLAMQNSVKKNGFEYCGIIYVRDGSERVAFEKLI
ncbi:GNAT family N-acetyltransferase [uncultured Clostridium sp.]|jgi:RimJ/RimL family protein N-acetyltransferase|uniref:GNAT family N-acetyltransferase n=1 Tax=uncultured Clostridium sp. TaxID=59620 RepID=UPI00263914B4|nr:GNAT family N-acetyltransferase [uncultured Clostridium sp.]